MSRDLELNRSQVSGSTIFAFVAVMMGAIGLGLATDRRLPESISLIDAQHDLRHSLRSGPVVDPVRRIMPETPEWPAVLVAAGDIAPPRLAPDTAPLPVRKNSALAAAHRSQLATRAADARTALNARVGSSRKIED